MQLETITHIITPTRSRILEKSTKLRLVLVFVVFAAVWLGGTLYCITIFPSMSTVDYAMMGGFALFGLVGAGGVVYLDFACPRELDIAVIGETVHLSAQVSFQPPGTTRFPLKNVKEVRYSALGGLQLRIVDRGWMKLPKLGTHEMRESMATWLADMAGVKPLR